MADREILVVCMLAGGVLTFGVTMIPILLGFKQSRRTRELEHIERMRALELGRPLPGEGQRDPGSAASLLALSIGAVVPSVAFLCAWLTALKVGNDESIWMSACAVGVSAVICGTILGFKSTTAQQRPAPSSADPKPYIEEDAYDVVASRG